MMVRLRSWILKSKLKKKEGRENKNLKKVRSKSIYYASSWLRVKHYDAVFWMQKFLNRPHSKLHSQGIMSHTETRESYRNEWKQNLDFCDFCWRKKFSISVDSWERHFKGCQQESLTLQRSVQRKKCEAISCA